MMKKRKARKELVLAAALLALGTAGCSASGESQGSDTKDVANEYYIDLTDLGMNLTIYLQLDEEGNFLFSNTLDFETNKSSGTFQASDGDYIMVYDSINGEEKSVSDGLTSTFEVQEDGSLDFTGCDYIYYGSAKATTTSEDHPGAKLIAYIVPENYDAPDTSTEFQTGSYEAEVRKENITYRHSISFYEDETYLHQISYEENGNLKFAWETGNYGVNIDQLALEPEGLDRLSGAVADDSTLTVPVIAQPGDDQRSELEFTRIQEPGLLAEFEGKGTGTEGENFDVTLKLYSDGSYETAADGFVETGVLVVGTEDSYVKQYPDHPETGERGLNQVSTVPPGICSQEGSLTLEELRVRRSEGLTRYECSVTIKE